MGGDAFAGLPEAELARRAAGGDGAAFVQLYDRYSAQIFETALASTASVETASAATQSAFLSLLGRPPAPGAPDADVAELLRALALGAGVEGARLRHPAKVGTPATKQGVGWLRRETVALAGERFDEDWSEHLGARPARAPGPKRHGAAAAAPPSLGRAAAARGRVVSELPLEPPPGPAPPSRRRSFPAAIADLPPRAAASAAILLALGTVAAAALSAGGRSDGDRDADASRAAQTRERQAGRDDVSARPPREGRARTRGNRRARGRSALAAQGRDATAQTARRGSRRDVGVRRRGFQRVAGRRGASAPLPRPIAGGGTPPSATPRQQTSAPPPSPAPIAPQQPPTPAPEPEPAPEPAPAPAPEPTRPSKPEPDRGSSRNCRADKTC